MKRVSLTAKVPGLCVLGALGVTFLLSPLGAFAGCGGGGGQQAAAPVATLKATQKFSECATRPISPANASKLADDGWAKPVAKNSAKATVGGVTPATAPAPAPKPLTPAELKQIGFMAGTASCSFIKVEDTTNKVNLQPGDQFIATITDNKGVSKGVFGMLVGKQLVFFTADQNGNHFTSLSQNPRVKLDNATIGQAPPASVPSTTGN